jgi:hypothetical protein
MVGKMNWATNAYAYPFIYLFEYNLFKVSSRFPQRIAMLVEYDVELIPPVPSIIVAYISDVLPTRFQLSI